MSEEGVPHCVCCDSSAEHVVLTQDPSGEWWCLDCPEKCSNECRYERPPAYSMSREELVALGDGMAYTDLDDAFAEHAGESSELAKLTREAAEEAFWEDDERDLLLLDAFSTIDALPEPQVFYLVRLEDETGTSGTGVVAEGIKFFDGAVAMRWRTAVRSTAFYNSMEDVEAIHGHGGKTTVIWEAKAAPYEGKSYMEKVNAPLSGKEVEAINSALKTGDFPHFKRTKKRDLTEPVITEADVPLFDEEGETAAPECE